MKDSGSLKANMETSVNAEPSKTELTKPSEMCALWGATAWAARRGAPSDAAQRIEFCGKQAGWELDEGGSQTLTRLGGATREKNARMSAMKGAA